MSKIRVDQVETLDGLQTVDVSALVDTNTLLTTSTGQQNLTSALDERIIYVDTLSDLKALDTNILVANQASRISSTGRAGNFIWQAGDQSSGVSSDTQEGIWVAPDSDATGGSGAWVRDFQGKTEHRIEWYGGGVSASGSQNRLAHEGASALARVILMEEEGTYTFDTPPTVPSQVTTVLHNPASISGASLIDLNAIVLESGTYAGIPFSPELRGKRIRIVSGSVKQSASDPNQWDWIDDASHTPLGFGQPSVDVDGHLVLPFDTTYGRVLSVIASPDESLAQGLSFSVGASVGLSSVVLEASGEAVLSASIHYDGTTWQIVQGADSGTGDFNKTVDSASFSGSTLTLGHSHIPGVNLGLTAWGRSGAVVPHLPYLKTTGNTSTEIVFVNIDGTGVVSSADTSMAFVFTKRFQSEISFNSGNFELDKGNIWIFGIMEV